MNIGIAQLNTVVGDVRGNMAKARIAMKDMKNQGAEIAVFPELFTTGYPPRDLLLRNNLINDNLQARGEMIAISKEFGLTVVFGYVQPNLADGQKNFFNAVCVARDGACLFIRHKTTLPTYDVFSEDRYFQPGELSFPTFELDGKRIGVVICEEAWNDSTFWKEHLYKVDPVAELVGRGAEYVIAINASPYRMGITDTREEMIRSHCLKHHIGFCYVNQVGYNDDVGFDGASFGMNTSGEIIAKLPFAQETVETFSTAQTALSEKVLAINGCSMWEEQVVHMLTMGIRDYFGKLGIKGPAIIGLSGGIDSAITAFLAVNALGRDRVIGVGMPSQFSSEGSVADARKLAKKLGIVFAVQEIKPAHQNIRDSIDGINQQIFFGIHHPGAEKEIDVFGRHGLVITEDSGVTDENIQARIRGIYLMGLANYYNGIVLSTGNKSEVAVGYCTIYGDMCGGLSVISDLYKTKVFDVCRWINSVYHDEIIPEATIDKPPSAELRANQKDQDSLPPYPILDEILYHFIELSETADEIAKKVADYDRSMKYRSVYNRNLEDDVYWVCQTVIRNEFKRKQAPTGLKLTEKLFKAGWEYPIVHKLPIRGVVKQETGAEPTFAMKSDPLPEVKT